MRDTRLPRNDARTSRPALGRAGITLLELLIVSLTIGILVSMAYPPVAARVAASHADNAALVVVSDLRHAVALAARQGTPVRIEFDTDALELRLRDRTGALVHRRNFGVGTEFPVASASASRSSVDVFPNRLTSGEIAITLVTPARSTQVVMTRAALIKIVRL